MPSPSRLPIVHELLGHLYSDREWEALCNRCGACCYESRWIDGGWEKTSIPCTLLNEETLLCRSYEDRMELEIDCIRVTPSVVLAGMMPVECSYVEELGRIIEQDHGGQDPRERWRDRGARTRRDRGGRRER